MNEQGSSGPGPLWKHGTVYEQWVGRWSRLVAASFIDWLHIPEGSRWLDIGCGTGALSQTILDRTSPRSVQGVDPSEGFTAYARAHIHDRRASFVTGDARALPIEDASRDVVVGGLMIQLVPADAQPTAVREMRRVVRTGGVVAVYVWDYTGEMEMMRHFWDIAAALDPAAKELDYVTGFALCRPEPLSALFHSAGLQVGEVRAIDIPTVFRDFDDYWTPFLSGEAPAPAYVLSLTPDRRAQLREAVRCRLPIAPDGSIAMTARAWAIKSVRP
jgi:SAM-dependent methyltransferase